MKVKMKNLGTNVDNSVVKTAEPSMPAKSVTRYPEMTLNTKQIDGLEEIEAGKKYSLVFEAEVKGFRTPEEWDLRDGLKASDMIVTFKLVKGKCCLLDGDEKKEHKSINEASMAAAKS